MGISPHLAFAIAISTFDNRLLYEWQCQRNKNHSCVMIETADFIWFYCLI